MSFTDAGVDERVKGAVHGALLTIAGACAIYSACAWARRKDTHLAINAAIYTIVCVYEMYQVGHHWGASQ